MNKNTQFVICIDNKDYPASLELCKVYRTLKNEAPERTDFIRVIDESGEDYYYPRKFFEPIDVPQPVAELFPA
jgi:hypothetical protein